MVSRFLCTTALEETWPEEGPILFLGEWCRRYSRRARWSTLDAEVLPYHWDDRARFYADYRDLRELHERLLVELRDDLNRLHGVDHSLRYWRILIGPWLGYFVQMLFDRWTCVQQSLERELSGTIVLRGHEAALVPNDMTDFARMFTGDEWNHFMYATLLAEFTTVAVREKSRPAPGEAAAGAARPTLRARVNGALLRGYTRIAGSLASDRDAFLLATYLRRPDERRVYRRLQQIPQLWRSVAAVRTALDPRRRQWIAGGTSRSEFEACSRKLIPRNLPTAYLEGYQALIAQAEGLRWPKRPALIWTSNAHGSDDVFKVWAAKKVEQGSSLVIGQHGGHYGVGLWSFTEDHDIAISDRYLTWGWSDPLTSKVTPVGQLKAKRPLNVRHVDQAHALMVMCSLPRFSYWSYSASVARQWLDYFADQVAFIAQLPPPIRDALLVRLYPEDFGWDQAERLRDGCPEVRRDDGTSKIGDLLRRSRLFIATYNATTYLEAFTMDIPTVMFWNPRHWELRPTAQPFFADLQRSGIFHETPESAARHVSEVWNDIEGWWNSPQVRHTLERFRGHYCRVREDLPGAVASVLRDVMSAATP